MILALPMTGIIQALISETRSHHDPGSWPRIRPAPESSQHRNPSPHREQDRFDPGGLTRLLGHGGGRLHRRGRVDDYGCTVLTTTTPEATTTAAPTTTIADACRDTFCVRYNIRPEAAWADGTPVTAEDFVFTYETIVDPSLEIVSREGYQLITGYEVVDDKTVVFAFDEIYAPWQTLFSFVLPAHILEGAPFNTVWDDAISMGSGPFTFVEWVAEERITLARNENYWGEASGDVQNPQCRVPRRRGGAGGCPGRR